MSKKGFEIGSGNVFKDIGVPNAEEHLIKAQLDSILKFVRQNWFKTFSRQGAKAQSFGDQTHPDFRSYLGVFAPLRENFLSGFGLASRQAR